MGESNDDINSSSDTTEDIKKFHIDEAIKKLEMENTIFCDQNKKAYIAVDKNGKLVLPVDSNDFRSWFTGWVMDNYNNYVPKDNYVNDAIRTVEAIANHRNKTVIPLYVRINCIRDSNGNPTDIYYDLGESVVHVNANGWKIEEDVPIMFKRFEHRLEQIHPNELAKKSDIKHLHQFVNIHNEHDWLLFVTFLISCYMPGVPRPILALIGTNGSGKSTPLRLLMSLTDCSDSDCSTIPYNKLNDLTGIASKHAVLHFDNISYLKQSASDLLCRFITGASNEIRDLYTRNDTTVYKVQIPILMNGITQFLTKEDILDRAIVLEVHRISDDKRMPEAELYGKFNKLKSDILGAIFYILSDVIKIYPTLNLKKYSRMADFDRMAASIAESMDGYLAEDFVAARKALDNRRLSMALDANAVAQAAKFLVSKTGHWEGTATAFLNFEGIEIEDDEDRNTIQAIRDQYSWPRNATHLSRNLKRAEVTISKLGIDIIPKPGEKPHYKQGQKWIELTDLNFKPNNKEKENG